ncbi:MAG: thymidylate synthase [Candidatus Nanoarchaeia archaeon]|nr:thymidylate synthase [Candidatus Nanoarchaeia archaeon]
MQIIKSESIGNAWKDALKLIKYKGNSVYDGEIKLKEIINLIFEIENPLENDEIIKKFGDEAMIKFMFSNFLEQEPVLNWGYSYGQRIFNFENIDQLEDIKQKLKKNTESKSATLCLMNPPKDKNHSPCINVLDFKIRDGHLILTAFFRSQDIGKKFYADALCITHLGKMITKEFENIPIKLVMNIVSAHIYEPDLKRVNEIIGE